MTEPDELLSTEEIDSIVAEALEKEVEPETYASNLLEKGRRFDDMSRKCDYLMDEIRRAQSGYKDVENIELP